MNDSTEPRRVRREPPAFRRVTVVRVEPLTDRMMRVSFSGPDLADLNEQPAASLRLLLPTSGSAEPTIPAWNGNEFLLPNGSRPAIRTFTPRRFHPATGELDLEIVLHREGIASDWARAARPGDQAAVSGPGRGYEIDMTAPGFLLAGDETALPAIGRLLEALPAAAFVSVCVELAQPGARLELPEHPRSTVEWVELTDGKPPGDALVRVVRRMDVAPGIKVWAAGEAGSMQRLRRYFLDELNLPRARATIRGYWKYGRGGT